MKPQPPTFLFADGDVSPPSKPADGQAQTAQPSGASPAPQGGQSAGGGFGGLSTILIMALPILLFFWMTRNQKNKQKQLEESIKIGDKVLLTSGIIGRVVRMAGARATVEIAPGVNVEIYKSAIQGPESPAPDPKDAKDAKDPKPAVSSSTDGKK